MSERDEMLPKEVLEMLVVAREGLSPGPRDVSRVRSSLSGALATGQPESSGESLFEDGGSQPPNAAIGSASGISTGMKLAIFGLSLGVGAGVGAQVLSQTGQQKPPSSQAPALRLPLSPSPDLALSAEPSEGVATDAHPPSVKRVSSPPTSRAQATPSSQSKTAKDVDFRAELALVTRARRAVNQGQGDLALGLLGELDEKHPRGLLMEERHATQILAHCANQNQTQAGASARQFEARWPDSVYGERIAQSCAGKKDLSQATHGSVDGRTPTQE